MLGLAGNARIFLYQPAIDMRKGFDGYRLLWKILLKKISQMEPILFF